MNNDLNSLQKIELTKLQEYVKDINIRNINIIHKEKLIELIKAIIENKFDKTKDYIIKYDNYILSKNTKHIDFDKNKDIISIIKELTKDMTIENLINITDIFYEERKYNLENQIFVWYGENYKIE